MASFSQKSLDKLRTCHPDLIRLFLAVVEEQDCTILEGHRGEEAQNKAFASGNSKVQYPNSKHNKIPSMAVDCVPFPIEWENIERFKEFGKVVLKKAAELNIEIRWGGDWDGKNDGNRKNELNDYPHFEVKE